MTETILVINAGSSSLKLELFDVAGDRLDRRIQARIEGIGTHPHLVARDGSGAMLADESYGAADVADGEAALARVRAWLDPHSGETQLAAVGHRVVHGGPRFSAPIAIDDAVLDELTRLVPLAPLHQPDNLAPIRAFRAEAPSLRQVACFDTAFHRGHPELADRYAIPEALYAEGVRRYGFHGLSYEYVAGRLRELAPAVAGGRVVLAHLGSGASLCAVVDGKSIESTMGFTALDGLPMGTRPGQLDPGVVLYLLAEKRMDAKALEHFLYHECGLKGLSGISNDVRDLLASPDPRARLALDVFAYRIGLLTGSLAAAMGGLDGFVFTAGIGENAPAIRAAVAERLAWLGLSFDPAANERGGPRLSAEGSGLSCYVIPTDEELMIARHTLAVLRGG